MKTQAQGVALLATLLLTGFLAVGTQTYGVTSANLRRPELIFAPSLAGFSPNAGNSSAETSGISISNVTTHPVLGTIRVALILAQFPDVRATRTADQIRQDYFGSNNSVAAYYHTVSYGELTIVGDVFGWYTLPYPEAHYGKNCLATNDADCSGSDASWQVAQDAVTLLDKNTTANINFFNYDYYVFVHSGFGQESSGGTNDVWSVTYMAGVWVQTTTKTLTKFNVTPELEARGSIPLGVYCHEFGHNLGLPDMYDTKTGKSRMGEWELMDKGLWNGKPHGSEPAELSAWSRNRLGWLSTNNIVTYDATSNQLTMMQPLEETPTNTSISAVVIPIASKEYYLFENREPVSNDADLPDSGIVGYHINENTNFFSTIKSPASSVAFHLGDLLSSSSLKAKVLASYVNSSLLVGFGSESELAIMQTSTLTLRVNPNLVVNAIINNQTYTTDQPTGQVSVTSNFSNETIGVTVPQTVEIKPGVRVEFQGWENGNSNSSRQVYLTTNTTIVASYKTQFLVSVESVHGTASGSGWYDENASDTVSVNSTVNGSPGTRYVFLSWGGDVSGQDDPITFYVTQPMNLTINWNTFNQVRLSFFDENSEPISPSLIDSLTLRAPNGTLLVLSNMADNPSYWFQNGTYNVLTAYVYAVDSTAANEQFTTSPNGTAFIQLQLYTLTFQAHDSIFGSALDGGNVTITLPNEATLTAPIKNGTATFNQLPEADYPYTISRDWSLQASGQVNLANQTLTTVGVWVLTSVVIILAVGLCAAFVFIRATIFVKRSHSTISDEESDLP